MHVKSNQTTVILVQNIYEVNLEYISILELTGVEGLVPDVDRLANLRVLEDSRKVVDIFADAHEIVEVVGAAGRILEERLALAEVAVEQ